MIMHCPDTYDNGMLFSVRFPYCEGDIDISFPLLPPILYE